MDFPGTKTVWIEPYKKHDFTVSGRPVTVVCPNSPLAGNVWAWKGEFLYAFPAVELALLAKGVYIVYMDYQDRFGSLDAVQKWNDFYSLLTGQYGFAKKPALIGLSRGGLYCYQWAIANPDRVACIYGDAPVCDMRSWPGGLGHGAGSPEDWMKVFEVFGFSSEADAVAYQGNPVDNLAALAQKNIPILHVYGDSDDVVPWEENTSVVANRYIQMSGDIRLISKPGCGHHPHGLDDPTPIVNFIMDNLNKGNYV